MNNLVISIKKAAHRLIVITRSDCKTSQSWSSTWVVLCTTSSRCPPKCLSCYLLCCFSSSLMYQDMLTAKQLLNMFSATTLPQGIIQHTLPHLPILSSTRDPPCHSLTTAIQACPPHSGDQLKVAQQVLAHHGPVNIYRFGFLACLAGLFKD